MARGGDKRRSQESALGRGACESSYEPRVPKTERTTGVPGVTVPNHRLGLSTPDQPPTSRPGRWNRDHSYKGAS
ncbi:hypothetical protein GCM10010231_33260 [Streptomyces sindenensis]|nr:hypothetical protein GCM10010231_33260 [Streptomyces sindenensis]